MNDGNEDEANTTNCATAPPQTKNTAETTSNNQPRSYQHLSNSARLKVMQALFQHVDKRTKEILQRGAISIVAKQFHANRVTIQRIWQRGLQSLKDGGKLDVSHKKCNSGRKSKDYSEQLEKLKSLPPEHRGTHRELAEALGIPKSTLYRKIKNGGIIKARTTIIVESKEKKKSLSEPNKQQRLQFCKAFVNLQRNMFDPMMNVVHIHEKYFYTAKNYIGPDETANVATKTTKKYLAKVRVLVAVARPRWDTVRNEYFNGKLGIWYYPTYSHARKPVPKHPNQPQWTRAGHVDSIAKKDYRSILLNAVLPAIQEKWPHNYRNNPTIQIQQGNSIPFLLNCDPAFQDCLSKMVPNDFHITLERQPPNSPDLNVLDMGFFPTMESLQVEHMATSTTATTNTAASTTSATTSTDSTSTPVNKNNKNRNKNHRNELIATIEDSFQKLNPTKLDDMFLTLQKVMESCILRKGNNDFEIPHTTRQDLERSGELPVSLVVSDQLHSQVEWNSM